MRNSTSALLIAGILTLTASARAAILTVSFDQLQIGEDVLNYYNGGLGNMGSGPGPSDGVLFTSGWIVGPPDVYGAAGGKSAAISGTATVNVAAGWSGDVSFYYSGGALVVDFFSQQNGLGTLVGRLNLAEEANFAPAGTFPPAFESAVFSSSNGDRIDALTEGALVIPEPHTAQLFLCVAGVLSLRFLRLRLHSEPEYYSNQRN